MGWGRFIIVPPPHPRLATLAFCSASKMLMSCSVKMASIDCPSPAFERGCAALKVSIALLTEFVEGFSPKKAPVLRQVCACGRGRAALLEARTHPGCTLWLATGPQATLLGQASADLLEGAWCRLQAIEGRCGPLGSPSRSSLWRGGPFRRAHRGFCACLGVL